jgi:hypothetical protein
LLLICFTSIKRSKNEAETKQSKKYQYIKSLMQDRLSPSIVATTVFTLNDVGAEKSLMERQRYVNGSPAQGLRKVN